MAGICVAWDTRRSPCYVAGGEPGRRERRISGSTREAAQGQARRELNQGNPTAALRIAKGILDTHGWDSTTGYIAGVAMFRLGEFRDAERTFRGVLANAPNEPRAAFYAGASAHETGRLEQAASYYHRALWLDPNLTEARERLRQIESGGPRGGSLAQDIDNQSSRDSTHLTPGNVVLSARPRLGAFLPRFLLAAVFLVAAVANIEITQGLRDGWAVPWAERAAVAVAEDERYEACGDIESVRERNDCQDRAESHPDAEEQYDTARFFAYVLPGLGRAVAAVLGAFALSVLLVACVAWRATSYDFYERRIDIVKGGVLTKHDSVWLYEIQDATLTIPPLLRLANTATLTLKTEQGNKVISGIGDRKQMRRLWNEVRDAAMVERRAMHRWWV